MTDDKSFRFDWYPHAAYADFASMEAEEVAIIIQIINLIYIHEGPIENDPKWISQSVRNIGPAKCRNIIKSLLQNSHIFITDDGKIFKKRTRNVLKTIKKRRKSRENPEKKQDVFEASMQQNQTHDHLLVEVEVNSGSGSGSISKVLEDLPNLHIEKLSQFFQHRKSLGKPVHENYIPSIVGDLKKIVEMGHDPNSVIDQSIKNGWSSLQPITKGKQNGKSKSVDDIFAELEHEIDNGAKYKSENRDAVDGAVPSSAGHIRENAGAIENPNADGDR